MRINCRYTTLLVLALLALFILPLSAQDTLKLKIIVTTDVHGSILPNDLLENKMRANSLAQVHTYVEQERKKNTHSIILLDNGDILQGDPFIYYYNFIDTAGIHPLAQVMNFMKFDAATIGNHDIETGHPVYDKLHKQFNFPWLGANIIDNSSNLPYFKPYVIKEICGKRIAVLGLCTPHIPKWLPQKLWAGMYFEDMVLSAQKWVNYIRKNERPDVLIGLFHTGAEKVIYSGAEIPEMVENAARLIAEEVGGFDVIFSGHDHRRWKDFIANPNQDFTLLLGAGSNARSVAVATISLISSSGGLTKRRDVSGDIVDVDRLPASLTFMNRFEDLVVPVRTFVSKPFAYMPDTLRSRDALFGYAPFVGLIHKVQLEVSKADISFAAPLSFDAVIPKGPVTWGELFKLYRFENQLYVMELSGREIKAVLEYSYIRWMSHMRSSRDNMLNFAVEEAGRTGSTTRRPSLATPFYNFESAAGINYVVDLTKPAGNRIRITSLSNGKLFLPDKTYKVAVNSYRGNGGGGHLTEGAGIAHADLTQRIIWSSDIDMRFIMHDWFKKQTTIKIPYQPNWRVIPELWIDVARSRDYKLLFDPLK